MSREDAGGEIARRAASILLGRLKAGTYSREDLALALEIGYAASRHEQNCRIWTITHDPTGDLFPDEIVEHCTCKPPTRKQPPGGSHDR